MFDGHAYDSALDERRLKGQIARVFACMGDGRWRTLREIAFETLDSEASISAQLRNLRKERFGGHTVLKQRRGEGSRGCWEYRLQLSPEVQGELFG